MPRLLIQAASIDGETARHELGPAERITESTLLAAIHPNDPGFRQAITTGTVRSAVFLESLPSKENLWAVESFFESPEGLRRLACEEQLLPTLEDSWQEVGTFREWKTLVPREYAQRVETPVEYRESIRSRQPVVIACRWRPIVESRDALEEWFGELADPYYGGAIALLALSGASPQDEEVELANPFALGLRFDDSSTSASALSRARILDWDLSGGAPRSEAFFESAARLRERRAHTELQFANPGEIEERITMLERDPTREGAPYQIVGCVAAIVDPDVAIPTGAVYEQKSINGVQTLRVSSSTRMTVDVNQIRPVALPAHCLDNQFASPNGEPLRPTPFVYPEGVSQHHVWRHRHLRRLGPQL